MSKGFRIFLILFIIADTLYTGYQHFHVALDGDMAAIILPADWYSQVLEDPFGISVLTEGKTYSGTNRFFAHWSLSEYYKTVPHWLQLVVSPINSVYLAGALIKTLVHLILIWLLAMYIQVAGKFQERDVLPAAALMVPLFQTMGYNNSMGIIDISVTYTFFYAMPIAVLMLFFLPFFKGMMSGNFQFSGSQYVLLGIIAIIVPFQGPLIPALVLLICPAVLLYYAWSGVKAAGGSILGKEAIPVAIRAIPKPLLFCFLLITAISLYSLYIGFFNGENDAVPLALTERYQRLLPGLFKQLTRKLGYPLLLVFLVLNVWLLHKYAGKGNRFLVLLKWLLVLAILYLLLLPLGGYRSYRPLIIRRDTFLPVTLAMFFSFGLTILYLLKQPFLQKKKLYLTAVLAVLLMFTFADKPNFKAYQCEREALEMLAASEQPVVKLPTPCTVMAWETITEPGNSDLNARLLHYWGITNEKRLYFAEE